MNYYIHVCIFFFRKQKKSINASHCEGLGGETSHSSILFSVSILKYSETLRTLFCFLNSPEISRSENKLCFDSSLHIPKLIKNNNNNNNNK